MDNDLLELVAFHLTGKRPGADLGDIDDLSLRPTLFTGYTDLSKLRYDYPLVLVEGDDGFVRSLSGVVDGLLQELAPRGAEGERLRKNVLGLEKELRVLLSRGAKGSLSGLWKLAEKNLRVTKGDGASEPSRDSVSGANGALGLDGEIIDCDGEAPVKLLSHAWAAVEGRKARKVRGELRELILKLSEILQADFMKSEQGRAPEILKGSIGTAYEPAFDFEAMSRILTEASSAEPLPEKRRRRIREALAVLETQRFFASSSRCEGDRSDAPPHAFVFDSCTQALEAFQDRLPEMIELIKSISIAELEIENRYQEAKHDSFFDGFDESALAPEDLALFPTYLACLRDGRDEAAEKAKLIDVLSSGLPIKVLIQTDDILGQSSIGVGQFSFGIKSLQLASMAVGLNAAYVLQTSASNLYQMRDGIVRGLRYRGPALFSIFSGSVGTAAGVSSYLAAAAAMQSRAFPAFTYDPAAGPDWASRFEVGDNPQADADWPVKSFGYEDEDLRRFSKDLAFTFVDFVACDKRYARHFGAVPRTKRREGMIPVREFLNLPTKGASDKVPYVSMVDENNALHEVIVEDKLIQAARRCGEMWRSLQELGGINNSHAERLLDKEKEVWEQRRERELEELTSGREKEAEALAPEDETGATEEPGRSEIEEAEEANSDDPSIETPRCTTCNECTEINGAMLAYDENMQAFIADVDAGTYRQMVEAAESCQVCIIHPGKPRNPNEPNLEELIARAEPFNT